MIPVSTCMITPVYTIGVEAQLREAMSKMARYMVGTLPVVDADQHLVGILLLDDVLTLFMPNFVELLRSADFIHDYSFLEKARQKSDLADKPIMDIMQKPYSVQHDSGLMEAMVLMHKHNVEELPVLDDDHRLIGIASRGRVGNQFLSDWLRHFPAAKE